jgi:hypothetical protein
MAVVASFSLPPDADEKCDAVTETGANVHSMVKSCAAVTEAVVNVMEMYGMVKSCTATVGEAFMAMMTMGMISRVRAPDSPASPWAAIGAKGGHLAEEHC